MATNSIGYLFPGTQGGGLFRSTDNGGTWAGINNGLSATNAATFGGNAFRFTDNGDSWTSLNTGVPDATLLSLAITASGYISQAMIVWVVPSA